MADKNDLATFTTQIATALVQAMDARPARRSGPPEDNLVITAGVWIDTGKLANPDGISSMAEMETIHGLPIGRSRPMPRSEIARITSRAPLSRQSVGRLNDEVSYDVPKALALLKALAADPKAWDDLFELDDYTRESLRDLDPEFRRKFADLVKKIEVFRDDLKSITFEIAPARNKRPRSGSDNPIYLPDKFELGIEAGFGAHAGLSEGSHSTAVTEVHGTATLVWEF